MNRTLSAFFKKRNHALAISGTLLLLMFIATHYSIERSRQQLECWYDKAGPTLRHIHYCEEYISLYPPEQPLMNTSDFQKHILSAIQKFQDEYEGATLYCSNEDEADGVLKDAWGRELHYFPASPTQKEYELRSAGQDGVLFSADDVGNWSDSHTTHELYRITLRNALLLFLLTSVLAGAWSYHLLKNQAPIPTALTILAIILFVVAIKVLSPHIYVDPAYKVPTSFLKTFFMIAVLGGCLTSGLLLHQSKNLAALYLSYVVIAIPIALWFWGFYLEVLR